MKGGHRHSSSNITLAIPPTNLICPSADPVPFPFTCPSLPLSPSPSRFTSPSSHPSPFPSLVHLFLLLFLPYSPPSPNPTTSPVSPYLPPPPPHYPPRPTPAPHHPSWGKEGEGRRQGKGEGRGEGDNTGGGKEGRGEDAGGARWGGTELGLGGRAWIGLAERAGGVERNGKTGWKRAGVGAGLGTKREGRGGRGSRYSARMEQKQGHGWEQDSWSGTGWEVRNEGRRGE